MIPQPQAGRTRDGIGAEPSAHIRVPGPGTWRYASCYRLEERASASFNAGERASERALTRKRVRESQGERGEPREREPTERESRERERPSLRAESECLGVREKERERERRERERAPDRERAEGGRKGGPRRDLPVEGILLDRHGDWQLDSVTRDVT